MVVFTALRTGRYLYDTQPNVRRFYNLGENETLDFLSKFWCIMVFFIPLAIATGLFTVAFVLFGLFLTFNSLVFGTLFFLPPHSPANTTCDAAIGNWLLVFGWLGLAHILVTNVLRSNFAMELCGSNGNGIIVDGMRQYLLQILLDLIQVVWVIWGYVLLQRGTQTCSDASMLAWFEFVVKFEFYGGAALALAMLVLGALSSRVLVAIMHLDTREQQPLLVVTPPIAATEQV